MPKAFPNKSYESIHKIMKGMKDKFHLSWKQYAGAWNAIGYRFKSCAENDRIFTQSMLKTGKSPEPHERYIQERALFYFFVNGLSALESLLFGLYAIVSFVKPKEFPIETERDLKAINPKLTRDKFKKNFKTYDIANSLIKLLEDKRYIEWKEIRNILAHRASPGREFFSGGDHSGKALWINGVQIEKSTTTSRYKWLTMTLSNLMKDVDVFVSLNVKTYDEANDSQRPRSPGLPS